MRLLSLFLCIYAGAAMSAPTAGSGTENFDATPPGALPPGWISGVTGMGSPKWAVDSEPDAPSAPQVLRQSGSGTFPWAVKQDSSLGDGFVQVRFKPVSGKQDQAGGVVWRWQSGMTYYVARANANENNVSLYYTTLGIRSTIKYVDAPVARGVWHTLRTEFAATRIRVWLDGKLYIEAEDAHIRDPGAVGVWTKADSVTLFDDFSFGAR